MFKLSGVLCGVQLIFNLNCESTNLKGLYTHHLLAQLRLGFIPDVQRAACCEGHSLTAPNPPPPSETSTPGTAKRHQSFPQAPFLTETTAIEFLKLGRDLADQGLLRLGKVRVQSASGHHSLPTTHGDCPSPPTPEKLPAEGRSWVPA